MTPKERLEYLKNRILKLALNHKIGNRDIANLEIKDIVMGIETHVIPSLEKDLTELEAPTSEEVCDDITKWIKKYNKYGDMFISVEYNQETKTFWINKTYGEFHALARLDGYGQLDILNNHYPPSTLLKICRFYEGLGK